MVDVNVKDINNLENTEDNAKIEPISISYDGTIKDRLKEVLDAYGDTFVELAAHLGISYQSMSKKINGHTDFKLSEIKAIKLLYNLDMKIIEYVFFNADVE